MVVGGMLGRTGDYRCSVAWWGTEVPVSDGTAVGPDSADVLVRGPLGLHRPDRGPRGRAGRRPSRRVLCSRAPAAGRPSGPRVQDHQGCADAADCRYGGGDPARTVHRARRGRRARLPTGASWHAHRPSGRARGRLVRGHGQPGGAGIGCRRRHHGSRAGTMPAVGDGDQDHKTWSDPGRVDDEPNSLSSNRIARCSLAFDHPQWHHSRAWRYGWSSRSSAKVAVCTWTRAPVRR